MIRDNGLVDDAHLARPPGVGGREEDVVDLAPRVVRREREPIGIRLGGLTGPRPEQRQRPRLRHVVEISQQDVRRLQPVQILRQRLGLCEPEPVVPHPVEVHVDDGEAGAVRQPRFDRQRDARLVALRERHRARRDDGVA
jgi:hypothetical protein